MQFDRPNDEIPSALLAGRLQGISLPDLLWALCRSRATGVLRLKRADIEKAVYVEDGRIVFASSGDPDDRLGELFLRRGQVTIDQLEQAIAKLDSGKRLGTLLVEAGDLEADQLARGVLDQVEGIVLDLFEWEDGDYRFERGPLPTEELIKLSMKTGELLLRGIRQLRAFSRIRRSVGAMQKTYGVTEDFADLLDGVQLTPAERSLVDRLAEGEMTVEDLCREVFLSNFEIYQTLWALKVLGVVEERDEPWIAPSDVTHRGSLAQIDFTELLVRLARGGETGVLYVTRAEHERSFHISGGRCVFATSNDPDDGLLSYLLRRGVISLRDREETAKRLLSNKRVGTILRELGVIDDRDLSQVVREQLSEIVYDTFRWSDAEYAFVPGPLPTVEEITLEEDLDALVARGIRRVGSWSRAWQGCGGLDVTLELKPSYLSVLDAMGAGPEEWEVVAALKVRRTPRQICQALRFGDFRVCQILWAMRVLGGVEAVAADEAEGAVAEAPAEAAAAAPARPRAVVMADPAELRPLPEDRALEESIVTMEDALDDVPVPPVVSWPAVVDTPRVESFAAPAEEPSPAVTQVIPSEMLEEVLRGPLVDLDREALEPVPPSATQILPREMVEAAVAGSEAEAPAAPAIDVAVEEPAWPADEVEPAVAAPAIDDWEPPADLDQAISRFNAAQRVVYRTVRAEVGAGAVNFIRSCCAQIGDVEGDAVAGVDLQADGSWDAAGLREAARTLRLADPWLRYQRLIDREIDLLRQFIGDSRAVELQRQVALVERSDAAR